MANYDIDVLLYDLPAYLRETVRELVKTADSAGADVRVEILEATFKAPWRTRLTFMLQGVEMKLEIGPSPPAVEKSIP